MDSYNNYFEISEETVAAWIDGNLSTDEETEFIEELSSNEELSEIIDSYDAIESTLENIIESGYELPAELAFDFILPDIENPLFEDQFISETFPADNSDYFNLNTTTNESADISDNLDTDNDDFNMDNMIDDQDDCEDSSYDIDII